MQRLDALGFLAFREPVGRGDLEEIRCRFDEPLYQKNRELVGVAPEWLWISRGKKHLGPENVIEHF